MKRSVGTATTKRFPILRGMDKEGGGLTLSIRLDLKNYGQRFMIFYGRHDQDHPHPVASLFERCGLESHCDRGKERAGDGTQI